MPGNILAAVMTNLSRPDDTKSQFAHVRPHRMKGMPAILAQLAPVLNSTIVLRVSIWPLQETYLFKSFCRNKASVLGSRPLKSL